MKTNITSDLIWLILILLDQVLPNVFNRFECFLNLAKLLLKYLIMKFIFKAYPLSSLIFNEVTTAAFSS